MSIPLPTRLVATAAVLLVILLLSLHFESSSLSLADFGEDDNARRQAPTTLFEVRPAINEDLLRNNDDDTIDDETAVHQLPLRASSEALPWVPKRDHAKAFNDNDDKEDLRPLRSPLRTTSQDARLNVFYHVAYEGAMSLAAVEQQLRLIQTSAAATRGLVVRYVTLGDRSILERLPHLCRDIGLDCIAEHHVDDLSPDDASLTTLDAVWRYCDGSSADRSIVYLHNGIANDNWRAILTQAALSAECLDHIPSHCNVCGLQFLTHWAFHFPGNMWAAECSIVRQLPHPQAFANKMQVAGSQALRMFAQGRLLFQLASANVERLGLDTASASEQWIASHPFVRPCDVDVLGDARQYQERLVAVEELKWAVSPRSVGPPPHDIGHYADQLDSILTDPARLEREYFLLPGVLLKWGVLYGRAAPSYSWVYRHFPDGKMWKDLVTDHGPDALELVTTKYQSQLMQHVPVPFAPRGIVPEVEVSDYAVFFDAYIDKQLTLPQVNQAYTGIQDQLVVIEEAIGDSVPLYVGTMGNTKLLDLTYVCQGRNLDCRRPAIHFGPQHFGETYNAMYMYCKKSPASRVTYVNSFVPRMEGSEQYDAASIRRLLLRLTRAALSKECRQPPAVKCNLCGLILHTIPFLAMAGDMFTADCSYVNLLAPPEQFVDLMQDAAGSALMMALQGQITMQLFEPREDRLGLGDYATQQWIASHPKVVPCALSLTANLADWMAAETPDTNFHMAPRYESSFEPMDDALYRRVRKADAVRLSEYQFLAGQLLRWSIVYRQTPADDSWVWQWYPDSEIWQRLVREHGVQAVSALADLLSVGQTASTTGT